GEGYWILSLNPAGEKLELPVTLLSSYTTSLKPGWNMIGGVSQVTDFTSPQDNPDNSIIPGTLYSWNPTSFSYQPETEILPNQGYWVLTLRDCQLTVRSEIGIQTAPQAVPALEVMIQLNLSAGDWHQNLEIGLDQSAAAGLEPMDRALPPIGPQAQDYQAHLVGGQYRLRRDIRPRLDEQNNWQIQLTSSEAVQLTVESQQIPSGQELVISEGQVETVLSAGLEMQVGSGERELTVTLRPPAKVTQLLQNYPNPFNPETWIPYQLSTESEVSLRIYSSEGTLVRQIDPGLKAAGDYQTTERAIYWDGRNTSGESVSSGIYFYRLQAGDYSQTRKMVILK
ncbi:MAG: FlgD immunoglobulin-like domain containing protein, partial [Candidatus Poribacteria bacterium]|nr:FlgD immunoglobulin-like domain containing protein [Candidatus Poribacteria bacterium]